MSLSPAPTDPFMTDPGGRLRPTWQSWLSSLQSWVRPLGSFGTTTQRPTMGLYIGYMYIDQSLGYPVWVYQVSPSIIWHNASGAAV